MSDVTDVTGSTTEPGRRSANNRVAQMLSIVPWIAAHDGPRVDDVCDRFGISRGQLLDDLRVVQFVGLPPYTPDMLIEVVFEGDRVWVRFADVFARPLRLTPDQALALVAAGTALAESDPDQGDGAPGPLRSGLAKLAGLLGIDPAEAVAIRLGASRPEVLETLRRAVTGARQVRIDYFTYSRDERSSRVVDPYRVFAAGGAWYLVGFCHQVNGVRTFRVDRIHELDTLETGFEPPEGAEREVDVFDVDPGAPRVVLDLAPGARWVVETYPVDQVEERAGGTLRARMPVASRAWLERLLLRLGDEARIVDVSDGALRDARQDAARRVLARYQDNPSQV